MGGRHLRAQWIAASPRMTLEWRPSNATTSDRAVVAFDSVESGGDRTHGDVGFRTEDTGARTLGWGRGTVPSDGAVCAQGSPHGVFWRKIQEQPDGAQTIHLVPELDYAGLEEVLILLNPEAIDIDPNPKATEAGS